MSTTAGLATQEYVAINSLAVATTLLGFATALAFLGAVFLVIGVAAIVCGLLALRQIRNSNGTQTGRGLAITGIALALVVAGAVGAVAAAQEMTRRADKAAVNAAIEEFGKRVMHADYVGAYAILDPLFQSRVSLQRFEQYLKLQQDANVGVGRMTAFYGNNFFEFSVAEGRPVAATKVVYRYEKLPSDGRAVAALRKDPATGKWQIMRLETLDPLIEPTKRQN